MKFYLDFEITNELKNKHGEDLENQFYANFCKKYVDQLKDMLDYKVEKVTTKKQIQTKDEKGEIKNELKNIDVYRFSMDLFNVKKTAKKDVNFKKSKKATFNNDIEKMEENMSKIKEIK